MSEWSPWGEILAPHLDGYFKTNQGQFRLTKTEDGGTRLAGTTWYRHDLAPALYWRLWSDMILHRIHRRVLRHIKREAEREAFLAGRNEPDKLDIRLKSR